MRNYTLLRNEDDGGGDGGGGGGETATATATETTTATEATGGTQDVFGGTVSATETTTSESQAAPTEGNVFGQLFNAEGTLAENYTDVLKANGMENLTNTVAKYTSPDGLLKGAANLVSFAGKKVEGVVIPTEGSSEQEVAEYRKAIGVPESATAYDIKPESMPEGMEWDEDEGTFWNDTFHSAGVSQEQAAQLSAAYSNRLSELQTSAKETIANEKAAHMADLQGQMQKSWGAKYGENMQAAVNMASTLGFDLDNADDMASVQNPKVLDMLLAKHTSLQEGVMPRGGESTVNTKGFREQANDIYSKYPNMGQAPKEVRDKYQELRKLAAKG